MKEANILEARIHFFISVSSDLSEFLKRFQSDHPLAPFLFDALNEVLKNLLERFYETKNLVTSKELLHADLDDSSRWKRVEDIDIGIGARQALRKGKTSQMKVLHFRKECREILILVVKKMKERSPLAFPLTRYISGFSPVCMKTPDRSVKRVTKAVEVLTVSGHVDAIEGDQAIRQWKFFLQDTHVLGKIGAFVPFFDRLDTFFFSSMKGRHHFCGIFEVVKKVIMLSHGNAAVERGFSLNKALLQPNILEDSLVGARHAYDGIKGSGGPLNVEITRPLLASCRNAGRRRNLALLERKSLEEKEQKEAVERKEDEYRLRELQTKKAAINLQRESLEQEIQDLKRRRVMF